MNLLDVIWEGSPKLKIKTQYFASLRELLGLREELVDVQSDIDVTGLLNLLAERHGPKVRAYIFDEKTGAPKQHLQFIIDGKSISSLQGLATRLHDGATFAVIPPVGGG
jgi:MoaD family protein